MIYRRYEMSFSFHLFKIFYHSLQTQQKEIEMEVPTSRQCLKERERGWKPVVGTQKDQPFESVMLDAGSDALNYCEREKLRREYPHREPVYWVCGCYMCDQWKPTWQKGSPSSEASLQRRRSHNGSETWKSPGRSSRGSTSRSHSVDKQPVLQYNSRPGTPPRRSSPQRIKSSSQEKSLMNGYNEKYSTDGSYYMGEWQDGLYHGQGRLRCMREQIIYDGFWKHGKRHGLGEQLSLKLDTVTIAHWSDNQIQSISYIFDSTGKAQYIAKDGSKAAAKYVPFSKLLNLMNRRQEVNSHQEVTNLNSHQEVTNPNTTTSSTTAISSPTRDRISEVQSTEEHDYLVHNVTPRASSPSPKSTTKIVGESCVLCGVRTHINSNQRCPNCETRSLFANTPGGAQSSPCASSPGEPTPGYSTSSSTAFDSPAEYLRRQDAAIAASTTHDIETWCY